MLSLLLVGCAFRVPAPVSGGPVAVPLVAVPGDPDRPYAGLGGTPWFVDTGASRTTCDDDYVASLGLRPRWTPWRSRGEVGTVPLRRVVLRDVEVAGWRFARLPCAVRDLDTTSSVDGVAAGVLGANLFRHFAVELDTSARTLELTTETAEEGLPLRRESWLGHRLVAELVVDGEPVAAVVDTGADHTYLPVQVGEEVRRYTTTRRGTGPGGTRRVEVVIREPATATVDGTPVPLRTYVERDGRKGLLGMDVLGHGPLVVDFRARRLRLTVPEVAAAGEGEAR